MTTHTEEDTDLTRLEQNAHTLLSTLVRHAGDCDCVGQVLFASREEHGLEEHRRITECALLHLFGTWAKPGPDASSCHI